MAGCPRLLLWRPCHRPGLRGSGQRSGAWGTELVSSLGVGVFSPQSWGEGPGPPAGASESPGGQHPQAGHHGGTSPRPPWPPALPGLPGHAPPGGPVCQQPLIRTGVISERGGQTVWDGGGLTLLWPWPLTCASLLCRRCAPMVMACCQLTSFRSCSMSLTKV